MSNDLAVLLGELTPEERAHWEALQSERIVFQRCQSCGHPWTPPRSECPHCLCAAWDWESASGRGELISWVVYHRAFHPTFNELVPYAVALVELAEGPRMLTALAEDSELGREIRCGAPVALSVVERGGVKIAQARLV
ncbi:MAG TPA: OB-fold domain-containing protein [Acidimicrobiia bacterium]|nr:OB-fold domain-containing protein [Acidimicrobiia bacterium]